MGMRAIEKDGPNQPVQVVRTLSPIGTSTPASCTIRGGREEGARNGEVGDVRSEGGPRSCKEGLAVEDLGVGR